MEDSITFKVEEQVTYQTIQDLLVCAFEGGSNYWYSDLEPLARTSLKEDKSDRFYENLLLNGFKIKDQTTDKTNLVLPNQFRYALELMFHKYPKHYKHIKDECFDAGTGDVFLQLLVFQEVIYG